MEPIRVVIADDEPLYRQRVTAALATERGVTIVGAAADGPEAIEMIRSLRPDVAILDTEMPRLGGLEVAAQCAPGSSAQTLDEAPLLIFLSGHSKHAVTAFDLRAVDYILKPFEQSRLGESLERARTRLTNVHVDAARESLMGMIRGHAAHGSGKRVAVKSAGRFHFLCVRDIDWIEPLGNYVKLHTAADTYVVKETMSGMIARLGTGDFCQVHRSRAVNIHNIRHITARSRRAHTIGMQSGACVPLSATYRDGLEKCLRRTFAALGNELVTDGLSAAEEM